MKKLLFIESNTTGTGMIALDKARELGVDPVFLTNNPARYEGLLGKDLTLIQCDTSMLSSLKDIIQFYVYTEQLAGITTTSEFYIETVALLNEHFGLEGNPPNVVSNVRNKAAMRNLLKHTPSLYRPEYTIVQEHGELAEKMGAIPYPCVVKPVDDSGSNLVRKCKTFTEVKEQVNSINAITHNSRGQETNPLILIEEFVAGQEYSVECFSFRGSHNVIGITQKKIGDGPFFVEAGHVFPAPLNQHLVQTIEQGALLILDTVNWQSGPAHLEVKIKNNQLFLVEFNGRLAGGMIPELVRCATGIDLLVEQLKVSAGMRPSLSKKIQLFAGIRHFVPERRGKISFSGDGDMKNIQGMMQWKLTVLDGEIVEKAENAYGRMGYMLALGETYLEVEDILDRGERVLGMEIKTEVAVHD